MVGFELPGTQLVTLIAPLSGGIVSIARNENANGASPCSVSSRVIFLVPVYFAVYLHLASRGFAADTAVAILDFHSSTRNILYLSDISFTKWSNISLSICLAM
jgi:hypothetical protein